MSLKTKRHWLEEKIMICKSTGLIPSLLGAAIVGGMVSLPLNAATVTFNYTEGFGTGTPAGPAPFATAVFDDGGVAGSVTLTMSVAGTVGMADVTQMYFNLDPLLDPTALSFTRDGGTGPTAANTDVLTGVDAFRAGGDGSYDILFDFPPPPGQQAARFNAGENLFYTITGTGLTADSFNFFGTPGPGQGNAGPFLSVARFQSPGDWVGAVPVPAAVWLFGSGLIGLVGVARRRKSA